MRGGENDGARGPAKIAITLFLALGFLLLVFIAGRVSDRGRFAVPFSVVGAGPEGAKGLFLLLEELGRTPKALTQPLYTLSEGDAVVVVLGGCERALGKPLSRPEREALSGWVEGGGTLIVAGEHEYLVDPDLGVTLTRGPCAQEQQAAEVEDAGQPAYLVGDPEWAEFRPLTLSEPATLVVAPSSSAQVSGAHVNAFMQLSDGQPAGIVLSHGQGNIVAISSAGPFKNRGLAAGQGGALMDALIRKHARPGAVLFDEYHLGALPSPSVVKYLADSGWGLVLLQLVLVVIVALIRTGARVAEPARALAAHEISGQAQVEALAGLYERGKDYAGVLERLIRRSERRLALHPSNSPRGTQRSTPSAKHASELERLRNESWKRPSQLLTIARALDSIEESNS